MLRNKQRLEMLARHLSALSPLDKISGGFGYIENKDSIPVKSIKDISSGDELLIRLRDGSLRAEVKEITGKEV